MGKTSSGSRAELRWIFTCGQVLKKKGGGGELRKGKEKEKRFTRVSIQKPLDVSGLVALEKCLLVNSGNKL
jgi:hypothetical protein